MEERTEFFVGLDVHKDSISVAACEAGRTPGRFVGVLGPDVRQLAKLLAQAGDPSHIRVVYEAGPTGFGLYRELCRRGYRCEIVAPSLIPQRAGDRIKNDRRDCCRLAELSRAGELKAIWVPDEAHESIRDLCRAREDAVQARLRARQQLKSFMLRHDRRYPGKTSWTKTHERWIADQRFDHAGETLAMAEYLLAVEAAQQRVDRLTTALLQIVQSWCFAPVVAALRSLRGVDSVTAIGLIAEIGDFERFETARDLMAYYASLGITVRRLLTDNGSAFRSKDFAAACTALGITHKFTRAYRPQTNGKAERFIQSALREWAYGWTYQNSDQRTQALASWQHHYNWHRTHAGISRAFPMSRLTKSRMNLLTVHS